jgi:hypothetical protein
METRNSHSILVVKYQPVPEVYSLEVKRKEREARHLSSSSAEVKMRRVLPPLSFQIHDVLIY